MAARAGLSMRRSDATVRQSKQGVGMSAKWLWMTAADLGRGIEAGKIHPMELTDCAS
jgi:hypothetical protein